MAGLPFDKKNGIVPNDCGQVIDSENPKVFRNRVFVAGWIKRGPNGVIGTNKPDAVETVHRMLNTFINEKIKPKKHDSSSIIVSLLKSRKVNYVSYSDWKILDNFEIKAGETNQRPRVKLTSVEKMLEIISHSR